MAWGRECLAGQRSLPGAALNGAMSVLYVSHGHPVYAKGGGELAAWRLFEEFRHQPEYEGSGFLAAAPSADVLSPGCELVGLSKDEWLIKRSTSAITHDTAVNLSEDSQLHQALAGRNFRLIHLHHYLHVGIDLVFGLKRWFPQAKLLLTLHDYWGPCVYEGRLLRSNGELCEGGDPVSCDQCLGENRRTELAIRDLRIERLFKSIDHFISPSCFLKKQYVTWGINANKISVVENLPAGRPVSTKHKKTTKKLIVGYFGQVNAYKGLDLLLEGVSIARTNGLNIHLEINGLGNNEINKENNSSSTYLGRCSQLIKALGTKGVTLAGRYEPKELGKRMAGLDALVMGSIWYENSPMVIQEAYLHGLPVIAPKLGGMEEKVSDGNTGLLFQHGSPQAFADCLCRLESETGLLFEMSAHARRAAERLNESNLIHKQIYQRWIDEKAITTPRPLEQKSNTEVRGIQERKPFVLTGDWEESFLISAARDVHNWPNNRQSCQTKDLPTIAIDANLPSLGNRITYIFIVKEESTTSLKRLESSLSKQAVEMLNNRKLQLLLDLSNESCSLEFAKSLEDELKGLGIKRLEDVALVCQNRLLINVPKLRMKVFNYDFFIAMTTRSLPNRVDQQWLIRTVENQTWHDIQNYAAATCLNATPKKHRFLAIAEAAKQGLFFNQSLNSKEAKSRNEPFLSCSSFPYPKRPDYSMHDLKADVEASLMKHHWPWLEKFITKLPYQVDSFELTGNDLAWEIETKPYLESCLSIVTETGMDTGHKRITEKTLKALMLGHPLVIIGTKGSIDCIEELGFQRFDKLINDDYDFEPIWEKRIEQSIKAASDAITKMRQDATFYAKLKEERLSNILWGANGFRSFYDQKYFKPIKLFLEGY